MEFQDNSYKLTPINASLSKPKYSMINLTTSKAVSIALFISQSRKIEIKSFDKTRTTSNASQPDQVRFLKILLSITCICDWPIEIPNFFDSSNQIEERWVWMYACGKSNICCFSILHWTKRFYFPQVFLIKLYLNSVMSALGVVEHLRNLAADPQNRATIVKVRKSILKHTNVQCSMIRHVL